MSKANLIDAVKTAKSIHDGDYSSLHGKSFVIRVNMKKKIRGKHVNKPSDGKMTLTKLASTVDNLIVTVKLLAEEMRAGFKQVNTRIDNLEKDVNSLKLDVKDINARLDYNNLKVLPNKLEK